MRPIHINLDEHAHELLLRVRHKIVERNKERSVEGRHTEFEGWTFKDIVQRGIALVERDISKDTDVI